LICFFRGKAVKELLQCILATPTKSYKSEPKISPAAQQLLKGSTEDLESLQREEEVKRLPNTFFEFLFVVVDDFCCCCFLSLFQPVDPYFYFVLFRCRPINY